MSKQDEKIEKEYIQRARDEHASDDLEIDDEPKCSIVKEDGRITGAWVAAWIWVEALDEEEDESEDE